MLRMCGSLIGSQIRYLINNLNKKNYKSSSSELAQLVSLYGQDACVYLICCLVEQIDFKDNKGQKDQLKIQLLREEIGHLTTQPNFASILCQAFEAVDELKDGFVAHFSSCLKLALPHEILLALGMAASASPNIQAEGIEFLKTKLPELTHNSTKSLPENVMHNLLYVLQTHPEFANYEPAEEALEHLQPSNSIALSPLTSNSTSDLAAGDFKRDFSVDAHTYLSPLYSRSQTTPHPAQLMEDLGYSCCASVSTLKTLLSNFPQLSEQDVAQIIGSMARTHTMETSSSNTNGSSNGSDSEEDVSALPLFTRFAYAQDESADKDLKAWDVAVFVDTMKELYPKLQWASVIKHLDYPGFLLMDQKALALIVAIYKKATKDAFPLDVLFNTIWNNTSGQLSFLKLVLSAPPDVFVFSTAPKRQPLIDALSPRTATGATASTMAAPNSPWYSLALIETLLRLAETEHHAALRSIFDAPLKQCPELLLLGLVLAKPSWNNVLRNELIGALMAVFLVNHPNSSMVLHKVYSAAPNVLVRGLVETYFKDAASLSRILDISHELKALNTILLARPFSFSIALAALASHREYLYLDRWLQDRINEHGSSFATACLTFIKEKSSQQASQDKSPVSFQLSPVIVASFFKALQNNSSILPPSIIEELKQLAPAPAPVAAVNGNGGVVGPTVGSPVALPTPPPGMTSPFAQGADSRVFPHDVEEEANSYIQRVIAGQLNIDQVVALMKAYKSSTNPREVNVLECFVRNLFDKYKYLPKFSDKELAVNATLFGSLIQHQLVSAQPLGRVLKSVLDALKNPPNTKMFKYGFYALEQFKGRLNEWPQYCSQLLSIPQIKTQHPEIIDTIAKALSLGPQGGAAAQQQPPAPVGATFKSFPVPPPGLPPLPTSQLSHTSAPFPKPAERTPPPSQPQSQEFEQPTLGNTLLLKNTKDIVQPDDQTKDKIHFIFNNVSQSNVDQKANELRAILSDFHDYLAQYLVVKRISVEQPFHALYVTFLEKLNIPGMLQKILGYTFENVKMLLKSDKLLTDISERSVLKHLGAWIGLLTLAKNKPLYHRDLSPKDLLIQSYYQATLVAVVPFVAKIMEACMHSKVFKPPNPWVMAIMRCMAEIYQLPDLKLNLKFEIELLCNNLQVDLGELKPSTLLSRKSATDTKTQYQALEPTSVGGQHPPVDFTNLANYITYNPSITLFAQQPILKRVVPVAIERAIKEIIAPVVERAVTIAVITTKELSSKDFSTEPDEQKMRRAAHLMAQNMAGSLALVTCKDPLRVSMANQLRPLFNNIDISLVEHAISVLCADNLDVACTVIERAAAEKAIREVDEALSASFALRRKYKEKPTGAFMDLSHPAARFALAIPEPLRPRAGGLQPHQLRVYEDFLLNSASAANNGGGAPGAGEPHTAVTETNAGAGAVQIVPGVTHDKPMSYVVNYGTVNQPHPSEAGAAAAAARRNSTSSAALPGSISAEVGEVPPARTPIASPPPSAIDKLGGFLLELEKAAARVPASSYSHLPPDHEVPRMIALIAAFIAQLGPGAAKVEVTAFLVQRILALLLAKTTSAFQRTVFLSVLSGLRDVVSQLSSIIASNLAQCSHEDEHYRKVVAVLLASHLISCAEYDEVLARLVDVHRNQYIVDFAVALLLDPQMNPLEFPRTLDSLAQMHANSPPAYNPKLQSLLDIAKSRDAKKDDKPGDETTALFKEWIALTADPATTDKQLLAFISTSLQKTLRNEKSAHAFFRAFVESAVESAVDKSSVAGLGPSIESVSYQAVDAFAKLVVFLVKYSGASPNTNTPPTPKVGILALVLNIVVKVLVREHEAKKTAFNQRPYFRLFDNWLIEFNTLGAEPASATKALDGSSDDITAADNADGGKDGANANNATTAATGPVQLQILYIFGEAFSALQPTRLPGFAFAWLELISHRNFMAKLLLAKSQRGWPWLQRLLGELLLFLEPQLRNAELTEPIRVLYKGTLRVLLVLLHDFPEFLCDFHFSFCDVIPPSCIQLRNIILSAFPRSMRLPDPFTPNLKVDLLPEINQPPRILSNYMAALNTVGATTTLKVEVDTYLKTRTPISFLTDLRTRFLLLPAQEAFASGTKYNVPVINSLVLYVGVQAIGVSNNSKVTPPIAHSAPMDIFHHLATDLDAEGRYLFLNAIANQLRYPNTHTHYFSCVLLYLFSEANQEFIKEQITRVLLERLIVNRPHPWGLLITFIELMKNPRYNFWGHSFTRVNPEIERLFESVARSCVGREQKHEAQPTLPQ